MNAAFRSCLEAGDALGLARLWRSAFPHLPQPRNPGEAELVLHRARSEAQSVGLARRLYSHAWLAERGLPSGLPDDLRPRGERRDPVILEAVGISVRGRDRSRAQALEASMTAAAAEAYAEGLRDPKAVSARIWAARARFLKAA